MVDYLNTLKLRNKENTSIDDYNCGGLAMNTFSWYLPYDCEPTDEIENYAAEGDDDSIIADWLAGYYINHMLKEFPNLRLLKNPEEVEENERLIAFRAMADREEEWPPDTDFHYRFFENGHWWEKCGARSIENCDESMKFDDWVYSFGTYNSRTFYLGLKL